MMEHLTQPVNIKDRKHLMSIVVTLFIFVSIPLTVLSFLTLRNFQPKAVSNLRGTAGDLWADNILGKRDFTEIWSGLINPQKVSAAGGAVIDRDTAGSTKGYLWLWSGIENRIVGVNLDNCPPTSGDCTAVKVIGQPSLTDYGACNGDYSFQNYPVRVPASASTLCGVDESVNSTAENLSYVGMYTKNGNLYVPDMANHRVLIYYDPWNTDSVADEVIGQDDFTGNLCNKSAVGGAAPTDSSLCLGQRVDTSASVGNRHGSGVTLDNSGNLWVADSSNHRVLRFPKQADGKISKTADIVLGQTDFTSGYLMAGSTLDKLKNPNSLRFDASGNLYVSDNGNNRILKYTPAQQVTGGSGTVFASDSTWSNIYIGEIDTINNGIWVTSQQPFNLALYGFDGTLKKSIWIAQRMVGSVGLGKDGSLVATSPTQGTLYFKTPMTATSYSNQIFVGGAINNSRLNVGDGVALAGNQLFATDACRVLVWNNPSTVTNGQAADAVLLQKDFNTLDCNAYRAVRIKSDSDGHVYIKTNKGIYIFQAPVTSASTPIKIITDPIPTISGGSMTVLTDYEGLMGLTPQKIGGQLFLWATDTSHSRVVRIRDPLGTPTIDAVVGQADLTSTACNRGVSYTVASPPPLNYLCLPGALSIDKFNNLYISDDSLEIQGNMRILMYTAATFPTGNTSVFFDATATKSFPNNGFNNAFEVAFDSQNHMVVGENSYSQRFFAYYLDPLDPASTKPNGFFKDFSSMTYGATFDSSDNLYVTDLNRSRILIYKTPFVEPVGNTAPTVQITSHQNNGWYSGRQFIKATATDDFNSATRIEFYIDNNLISTKYFPDTSQNNYSAVWDPGANGPHTLTVKAYDEFERVGQSSITFNIDGQGPAMNFNGPASASTVSGIVPVTTYAKDSVSAVAKVEFYVDGNLVTTDTTDDSYGFLWDTTKVSAGSHTLTAKGYDLANNVSVPSETVNVDNSSYVAPPPPVGTTVTAFPNGVGAFSDWVQIASYPTGQSAWQAVNETVPDEMLSTIFDNSWNVQRRDTFKTDFSQVPVSATINSVQVFARARVEQGNTAPLALLLNVGGTLYASSEVNPTANFANYSNTWTKNPANGNSWTTTDLSNLEIGVKDHLSTLGGLRVTAVWAVVDYGTSVADSTQPTVSITSPVSGAPVSGTTTITASASDNVGVARVDFLVGGQVVSTSTTSPYQFNWDTTKVVNNSYQLTANAYDGAGNVGSSSLVTVSVANGDSISPSTPTNLTANAPSATQVNLSWTASTDNVGVAGYYIVRGGTTIASSTTNSFSDTTVSPSTNYSYNVIAYDAAANKSALSNTYNITTPALPDTQAPTAPTNLAATTVSSSQINLTWTAATDNVGVTGYDIYRNGSKLTSVGAITSFGDTGLAASTPYSYYVIAKDAAGNPSTASGTVSATTQTAPVTQGTLTGTVTATATGSLLSGATVSVTISGAKGRGATIASATTNSSGVYLIILTQGTYTVTANDGGYNASSASVTITAGATTTKNFSLTTGGGKKK